MNTCGNTDKGRIVVLADIHSNLPALDAVLEDAESRLGSIVPMIVLGDVISLGPNPNECVTRLRSRQETRFVSGNNERYIVERLYDAAEGFHKDIYKKIPAGIRDNLRWTRDNLLDESIEFLMNWPCWLEMDIAGRKVFAAHGSRHSDEDVIPRKIRNENFAQEWREHDVYMFGHTHQPFVERVNGTLFLNPGSVGAPLDGDIRASYAILDLSKDPIEIEIRRVEYDLEETVRQMTSSGVPWADEIVAVLRRASLHLRIS